MKIYWSLESFEIDENTAVGLGNFDGVHLGHRKLITVLKEESKKRNLISTVLTFEPHPSKVLFPDKEFFLISTLDKKVNIIKNLGVNILIIAPFTQEFSKIKWIDFVNKVLIEKLKTKLVVVGYDFTFGYGGEGNAEKLSMIGKEKGFETIIIPPVKRKGEIVSSSKIRALIKEGLVEKAEMLLGYPFCIEGRVIEGKSIGRKLGFPTANIEIPEGIIIPAYGVYSVIIKIKDKVYEGIANLGLKPTFKNLNDSNPVLEVHIFDFKNTIYGEKVEVYFLKKIRDEKKFNSPNELAEQIKNDIIIAREIIKDTFQAKYSCNKG